MNIPIVNSESTFVITGRGPVYVVRCDPPMRAIDFRKGLSLIVIDGVLKRIMGMELHAVVGAELRLERSHAFLVRDATVEEWEQHMSIPTPVVEGGAG